MKRVLLLIVLAAPLQCLAQVARPSVYIEPQNGFETYVAAAIAKKQVPVDVVTDPAKATFTLKAAPVEIKQESTGVNKQRGGSKNRVCRYQCDAAMLRKKLLLPDLEDGATK